MAKVKEISVEVRVVKNLGNYETYTAQAGIVVSLEDKDKLSEVYDKAWEVVESQVANRIYKRITEGTEVPFYIDEG